MFKENSKAIYLQIADRICNDILSGQYAAGARMPSVREYAAMVEVNPNTVMRTYEYLADNNIIYNRRGIGFFVDDNAPQTVRAIKAEQFVNGELPGVFDQLHLLGIAPEQLKTMYNDYLTSK